MKPALANSQVQAKSSVSSVKLHNNVTATPAMKHDTVSFGGMSAARLANEVSSSKVYKAAEEFFGEIKEKATPKKIAALVSEIAEKVVEKDSDVVKEVSTTLFEDGSNAQKFINKLQGADETKGLLNDFFGASGKLINESRSVSYQVKMVDGTLQKVDGLYQKAGEGFQKVDDFYKADKIYKRVPKEFKPESFKEDFIKDVKTAMETMPTVNKKGGIYKSSAFEKIINIANDNSAVFSACAAALFACIFRPATIMAMPAKGKNKEDNKYSAAHSISSGLVGVAMAVAVNLPIAFALRNLAKNPAKYAEKFKDPKMAENLKNNKVFGRFMVDCEGKLSDKKFDDCAKMINLGSELLFAIPQALVTTALIPPVLKKLGIQKSSSKAKQVEAQQNNAQQNVNQAKDSKKEVSFKGKQVNFEGKGNAGNILSSGFAKLFSTNWFPNWVDRMNKSGSKLPSMVQILSTAKSGLISGMYVLRTINNKDLDPDRRTTLAINQASVWGVATILNLKMDKYLNKLTDKFIDNYRAANVDKLMKNAGDLEKATVAMNRLNGGIKTAKSLLVVSLVYRYLSPVLVTPFANKIGNFVEAKKKEKQASANV